MNNSSTSPLETSSHPCTTDPSVSFDIDLKEKLHKDEVINVDYAALRQTLATFNAPSDSSELSIVVQTKKSMPEAASGVYYPPDKEIDVVIDKPKKLQKTLQHELWHYADMTNNPPSSLEEKKNLLGHIGGKALLPFSITNAGLIIFNGVTRSDSIANSVAESGIIDPSVYASAAEIMSNAQGIATVGVIGSYALYSACYTAHKRERTARKAEKETFPAIISVAKPSQ